MQRLSGVTNNMVLLNYCEEKSLQNFIEYF